MTGILGISPPWIWHGTLGGYLQEKISGNAFCRSWSICIRVKSETKLDISDRKDRSCEVAGFCWLPVSSPKMFVVNCFRTVSYICFPRKFWNSGQGWWPSTSMSETLQWWRAWRRWSRRQRPRASGDPQVARWVDDGTRFTRSWDVGGFPDSAGAFQDHPSSFLDSSPQLLYTRSYVQDARMMWW